MSDFSTQLRLPVELKDKLDSLLEKKYSPMKPPSRNSVFVLAIEEFVARLEADNLSRDEQEQARTDKKSGTS